MHLLESIDREGSASQGPLSTNGSLSTVRPTLGSKRASSVLHRSLHESPRRVVQAEGCWLTLDNGRNIIDATGGAAVSCLGHGDRRVAEAVVKQMNEVAYCHSGFFGTSATEQLAQELVDSTEGVMKRAMFLSSGSEAMEAAIKLARQYFLELSPPQPQRSHFIARAPSYHGNTLGALAVSGHKLRREPYEAILATNTSHVSPAYAYRGQHENEPTAEYVARLAKELDDEFQRLGSHTVCAFVAEPVVGAAMGCVPAPTGYFPAIKEVCDKYGALLILDEVMCGMGRSGTSHAWQHPDIGVAPDLQTMGKGLGAGYVPISALIVGEKVYNALNDGSGAFVHGHTYQGHPVACAAALAVQNIIREDELLSNVRALGSHLSERLISQLADHPNVGDIRGRGLFWGIELVADKASRRPFPPFIKLSERIADKAMNHSPDQGMTLYPGSGTVDGVVGDHVILAPAFNVDIEVLDLIVEITSDAICRALAEVSRELTSTS